MAFLVSIIFVGIYCWDNFSKTLIISDATTISLPVAIISALTALISLVTYFWIPKKYIFIVSLSIFYLSAAAIGLLIISTGWLSSPFIALWLLVGLFAAIFGQWGLLPALIAASIFAAINYINNRLTTDEIIIISIYGLLPLIISLTVWHSKSDRDAMESDDRAYKNLANELNEVASKSEVVINAIGDGVIAIDSQGIIQLINPAAQQIIGWVKQDALALNYKSILRLVNQNNESLDPSCDPIRQVLNNNQQIRENDLSIMTKNDKKIMISLVVSPVGETGSGVIAVFHDVTKERAEEREQAEFISTASHEMRTPVASIEGYLSLSLNPQTAQIDDRARDFIMKAHASAEHLGHLFQDLLDISKADDGRISNNPQVMNIVTFVHDVVQGLAPKAAEKGLRLIYKPMPDNTSERYIAPSYSVNVDNDHVREIVNNLVENAIKYTPNGEILIDINGDDDHVVISVKDSGIGIPTEDIPHLFQKFYRVDNKDTREIGGTGLGLYLCRRLSEIMGGRIWAESVRGSGSVFYVELPRMSSQELKAITSQRNIVNNNPIDQIKKPPKETKPAIILKQPVKPAVEKASSVPRGQALTPEQIAAYVAKQRALAQQQAALQAQQAPPQTTKPVDVVNPAPQIATPAPAPIQAPAPVIQQTRTPEQIAAYVAEQRQLAQKQASLAAASRTQGVSIPDRRPN